MDNDQLYTALQLWGDQERNQSLLVWVPLLAVPDRAWRSVSAVVADRVPCRIRIRRTRLAEQADAMELKGKLETDKEHSTEHLVPCKTADVEDSTLGLAGVALEQKVVAQDNGLVSSHRAQSWNECEADYSQSQACS